MTEYDKGMSISKMAGWKYYEKTILRERKMHLTCVVTKAFKRSFMVNNNLLFTPGILHEDTLFIPYAFYYAGSVKEIANNLYHYRIRQGSKMSEYSFKQIEDKCIVINKLARFFLNKSDISIHNFSIFIASNYISFHGIKILKTIGNKQKIITAAIDKALFKKSCVTYRHRFLNLLIRLHPGIYRFYSRISTFLR
jgi:hypothetical protein